MSDWKSAETPPPESDPDCIVRLNDGTERLGNACHDPRSGEFAGWMFEGGPVPDEDQLAVIAWRPITAETA